MFVLVTEENIEQAAFVHAASWRESHRAFCSPVFIEAHTTQRQIAYIRDEMAKGRTFYMLVEECPKGIVSVLGNLIENLYVHPEAQRRGYGTRLLRYAQRLCLARPVLWVLNSNDAAHSLYLREGYTFTGAEKILNEHLRELEMIAPVTWLEGEE